MRLGAPPLPTSSVSHSQPSHSQKKRGKPRDAPGLCLATCAPLRAVSPPPERTSRSACELLACVLVPRVISCSPPPHTRLQRPAGLPLFHQTTARSTTSLSCLDPLSGRASERMLFSSAGPPRRCLQPPGCAGLSVLVAVRGAPPHARLRKPRTDCQRTLRQMASTQARQAARLPAAPRCQPAPEPASQTRASA